MTHQSVGCWGCRKSKLGRRCSVLVVHTFLGSRSWQHADVKPQWLLEGPTLHTFRASLAVCIDLHLWQNFAKSSKSKACRPKPLANRVYGLWRGPVCLARRTFGHKRLDAASGSPCSATSAFGFPFFFRIQMLRIHSAFPT